MSVLDVSKINTLLFDFGNVFFDLDFPKWKKSMRAVLFDHEPSESEIGDLKSIFRAYEMGQVSETQFANDLINLSDRSIREEEILNAWNSIFIKIDDSVFSLLLSLRQKYSVYLLSNINETHFNYVMNYLEAEHQVTDWDNLYFDGTFYSHLMKMRKPEENIYLKEIVDT